MRGSKFPVLREAACTRFQPPTLAAHKLPDRVWGRSNLRAYGIRTKVPVNDSAPRTCSLHTAHKERSLLWLETHTATGQAQSEHYRAARWILCDRTSDCI